MDKSIREYIINNFKDDDYETIKKAINSSISEQDEVTLPGMGVFFEIVWTDGDEDLRNLILEILKNRFQKG